MTEPGPDFLLRSRLRLRHLRLLLAIDEHRNLHRAAASVSLSQPAASKLVAELEDIVGAPLFERRPRGLQPNARGDVLIRRARIVIAELTETGAELIALRRGQSGSVSVGAVTAPALELLVPAVENIGRSHPLLQITIEIATSDRLARRVAERKLDFALARIPADLDPSLFEYEQIGEEELCFVCRNGHPLLRRGRRVALSELVDQQWVLQVRGTLLRRRVDRLFQEARLPPPERVIESAAFDVSFAIAARTDALTVAGRALAELYCPSRRFRILPFAGRVRLEAYGFIRPRGHPLSPGARVLLDETRLQAVSRT